MRSKRLLAALALACACGGGAVNVKHTAKTNPTCFDVARHLLRLEQSEGTGPLGDDGLAEEMTVNRCGDEGWTAAQRTCLYRAHDQSEAIDCISPGALEPERRPVRSARAVASPPPARRRR